MSYKPEDATYFVSAGEPLPAWLITPNATSGVPKVGTDTWITVSGNFVHLQNELAAFTLETDWINPPLEIVEKEKGEL